LLDGNIRPFLGKGPNGAVKTQRYEHPRVKNMGCCSRIQRCQLRAPILNQRHNRRFGHQFLRTPPAKIGARTYDYVAGLNIWGITRTLPAKIGAGTYDYVAGLNTWGP